MRLRSFVAAMAVLTAGLSPSPVQQKGVPAIIEVQRMAIEHARLAPSEISNWKKRVRYAALLPKFQIDYGLKFYNEVNVNVNDNVYVGSTGSTVGPEEGTYQSNQNANTNIGVKAVWDFSQALFNPDQLAISEETRLLSRERQQILAEVNRNYYAREKAAGEIEFLNKELKADPRSEKIRREIFAKRIEVDESAAALDALTGGWFSRQLK